MSGTISPPAAPTPAIPPPATEPTWAKTIVSVIGLAVFGFAYWASWKTNTGLELMNGAAIGGFYSVINFWLGNSADSDKKTNIISRSSPPQPPTQN